MALGWALQQDTGLATPYCLMPGLLHSWLLLAEPLQASELHTAYSKGAEIVMGCVIMFLVSYSLAMRSYMVTLFSLVEPQLRLQYNP